MNFARCRSVDGLDDYREESWTAKNGVPWLRDLQPPEILAARILTYGYDANTRGKEQLNNQTLFDHAETLVSKLVMFRKMTLIEERPIILVAHILGWIVLKYALVKSSMANTHLLDYREIE